MYLEPHISLKLIRNRLFTRNYGFVNFVNALTRLRIENKKMVLIMFHRVNVLFKGNFFQLIKVINGYLVLKI